MINLIEWLPSIGKREKSDRTCFPFDLFRRQEQEPQEPQEFQESQEPQEPQESQESREPQKSQEPPTVLPHDCSNCEQCKTNKLPCQPCIRDRYLKIYENDKRLSRNGKWLSGNEKIDKLIKCVRPSLVNTILFLEWIPYENLTDITHMGEGGFGTISLAKWNDGHVVQWDHVEEKWHRQGEMQVVLKTMKYSNDISEDFLAELEAYFQCASPHLISYFGITRNPETKDYAIVMEYAENGDLRKYLKENRAKLYWRRKLDILRNIVAGLEIIHVTGMTHRDLHTGNILQFKDLLYPSRITDLGLSKQANTGVQKEKVAGVLPYIPPEVLDGKPYTEASDIYSFAMILWEVATGEEPHADNLHDPDALENQIKNGLRPKIPVEIPECYATLIEKCWHKDPKVRPTALDIKAKIMEWQSVLGWFPTGESRADNEARQFEEADDNKSKEDRRYRDKKYNSPPKSKPLKSSELTKTSKPPADDDNHVIPDEEGENHVIPDDDDDRIIPDDIDSDNDGNLPDDDDNRKIPNDKDNDHELSDDDTHKIPEI